MQSRVFTLHTKPVYHPCSSQQSVDFCVCPSEPGYLGLSEFHFLQLQNGAHQSFPTVCTLALELRAYYLISLCLRFLVSKRRLVIPPPSYSSGGLNDSTSLKHLKQCLARTKYYTCTYTYIQVSALVLLVVDPVKSPWLCLCAFGWLLFSGWGGPHLLCCLVPLWHLECSSAHSGCSGTSTLLSSLQCSFTEHLLMYLRSPKGPAENRYYSALAE